MVEDEDTVPCEDPGEEEAAGEEATEEPSEPEAPARQRRRWPYLAALVAALAAGAVGGWQLLEQSAGLPPMPAEAREAVQQAPEPEDPDEWRRKLPEPLDKPDLQLTDTDGDPYDFLEETAGRPTLLFFGFSNCPDACPAQMAILSAALEDLPTDVRDELEVVFVSVDPERDSPERLGQWLATFDASIVGLTGDMDEVEAAMGELNLAAPIRHEQGESSDAYVMHASPVVAFHPTDDRAHTMYPLGIRQHHWEQELPRLVEGKDLTG